MTAPGTNPQVLLNKGAPVTVYVTELRVEKKTTQRLDPDTGELSQQTRYVGTWVPEMDENQEARTRREWIRFTNNSLAALEMRYGSMEEFQTAAESHPSETVRTAIGLMLGEDMLDPESEDRIGAMLMPSRTIEYQMAVMAALSIANGVDPTQAARLVDEGRRSVAETSVLATKGLEEMLAEQETERAKRMAEAGLTENGETPPPEPEPEPVVPETEPEPEPESTPTSLGSDGSEPGLEPVEPSMTSGE